MNQLATTPPGASADTAGKNAAAIQSVPLKFRTVEELRNSTLPDLARGQIPPLTRIPVGEIIGEGVAESTLSERGAELAAMQAIGKGASDDAMCSALITGTGGFSVSTKDGEPPLQDESRGLSQALASAPHAKLHATEAAAKLAANAPQAAWSAMVKIDPKTGHIIAVSAPTDSATADKQTLGEAIAAVANASDKLPIVAKATRRAPMSMVKRLDVLDAVRKAPADKPDAELAATISLALGHAVGSGTVASYRAQLGLPSVKMPSKAELRAKLAIAEQALAAAQQPTLPLVEPAPVATTAA